MVSLKSFLSASAVIALLPVASAGVLRRNEEPPGPSCVDFTPFVYAGCFQDQGHPAPDVLLYNSNLNTQNMTIEQCVAFCKGNDYRYAGLEYYGECSCGASVNGPQVEDSLCSYPCTGDQTEVCGGTSLVSIYQDPTFPVVNTTDISDYQHLGCYSEGSNGRSLAWRQDSVSETSTTVNACLQACKAGGYPISGLEFGQECYCGVVLGNGTAAIDPSQCNNPCTGDSSQTCGGSQTLDLYVATDLESSEPCGGGGGGSSSSSSSISSTASSTIPSTSSTVSTIPSTTPTTSSTVQTTSSTTSTTPSTVPTTSSTISPSTSPTTKPTTPPTSPPTTTVPTKTTASICTSTTVTSPTPTCEYQCGNWCSKPLPTWGDQTSCLSAYSNCALQVASCFVQAGFPDSIKCFEFSNWCQSVSSYCQGTCKTGSCSKEGCNSKYPPSGPSQPKPTTSTITYTCPAASGSTKPATTTSSKSSSTSCVPIPTNSNICTQPNNPSKGYSSQNPVGNIPLPCLTCNNDPTDYNNGNCFKLYTFPDSTKCPSYTRGGSGQGCKAACDAQYQSCINTYAAGCKLNFGLKRTFNPLFGDSYNTATTKCQNQRQDCYTANSGVSPSNGRCGSFNTGWY